MDFQDFASTLSIAFAALISAFAYLYKNRMESKRSARKVLYYLLEIRYSINTSLIDPNAIYEQYISQCLETLSKRIGIINREQLELLVGKYIHEHFVNIAEPIRTEIDERILIPYEQSLLELAEVDPITAYKLRGKERIQEAITHTQKYSKTLESEILPNLPFANDNMNSALKEFSTSQHNDALNGIENCFNDQILMVAKSCSFVDYLKCKKILKSSIDQSSDIDFSELTNLLDELLEIYKAQLAKTNGQATHHVETQ